ncbi:hypothetical protein BVRB_7g168380 [Beta vulgaris subsp. vulgaris]|nr:hypothetical protein BVRB_7g168380 [Beta vulgaris subsp. vulgaris]
MLHLLWSILASCKTCLKLCVSRYESQNDKLNKRREQHYDENVHIYRTPTEQL